MRSFNQRQFWLDSHPAVVLARKFQAHDVRLRALLAVVMTDPPPRRGYRLAGTVYPDGYRHPVDVLATLCDEVLARLGVTADGEFYETAAADRGVPRDFAEATRWLRDRRYVSTTAYQEAQWLALRVGADWRLLRWLDAVIEHFGKEGIPLFPSVIVSSRAQHAADYVTGLVHQAYDDSPWAQGFAAELCHCQYGVELPELCWQVIRAAGDEIAGRQGLALEGVPGFPEQFILAGWRGLKDDAEPADVVEQWLSRSPPGEREVLLRYYGIVK